MAASDHFENVAHERGSSNAYRATRGLVLDYDTSFERDELLIYGILIGIVNQAGNCDYSHAVSQIDLEERYHHTNHKATTALRQAVDFDLEIDH